jgi:hypothetical protein
LRVFSLDDKSKVREELPTYSDMPCANCLEVP